MIGKAKEIEDEERILGHMFFMHLRSNQPPFSSQRFRLDSFPLGRQLDQIIIWNPRGKTLPAVDHHFLPTTLPIIRGRSTAEQGEQERETDQEANIRCSIICWCGHFCLRRRAGFSRRPA